MVGEYDYMQPIPQHSLANDLPYQAPMRNNSSNILFLTNPQTTLSKLENTYRGYEERPDGTLRRVGMPMMNEQGINSVIGTLNSVVNQVGIMGNLNKDDIPRIVNYVADTLAKDLMCNRESYAIVSPTARDKIYTSAVSLMYVTLKRSLDEGDRRFWKGSVMEMKSTVESNSRQKGWLQSLNPFKN